MEKFRGTEYRISIFGVIVLIAYFFFASLLLYLAYILYLPETVRGVIGLLLYTLGAGSVFHVCLRRVPSTKVGASEEEWWDDLGPEELAKAETPEKTPDPKPRIESAVRSNVIFTDGVEEEVCVLCPRREEDVSEVLLKTESVPAGISYTVLELQRREQHLILRVTPKGSLARKRHEQLRNRVRFGDQPVKTWIKTSEGWVDSVELPEKEKTISQ